MRPGSLKSSILPEFNSEWRCADANSSPTRLGATRLIEEFNSLRFQVGMALCRLKLISDQVRFDQAHRRVQFAKSSTGEVLAGFVAQTFCSSCLCVSLVEHYGAQTSNLTELMSSSESLRCVVLWKTTCLAGDACHGSKCLLSLLSCVNSCF